MVGRGTCTWISSIVDREGVAVDSCGTRDDWIVVEEWSDVFDEKGKSHWKSAIITPRTVKITNGTMVIQVP